MGNSLKGELKAGWQVLVEQLTSGPWNNFVFMLYMGLVVEGWCRSLIRFTNVCRICSSIYGGQWAFVASCMLHLPESWWAFQGGHGDWWRTSLGQTILWCSSMLGGYQNLKTQLCDLKIYLDIYQDSGIHSFGEHCNVSWWLAQKSANNILLKWEHRFQSLPKHCRFNGKWNYFPCGFSWCFCAYVILV